MNAGQLHQLARFLREVATAATANPGEPPVSAGDLAIVEDIANHPATSIGQIARRTGLAQSLVSKRAAAMAAVGVLTTVADPTDGRRTLVSIDPATPESHFASRAARPIGPGLRATTPALSDEEIERLTGLLDTLASQLLDGQGS